MVKTIVELNNPDGLHVRPGNEFVSLAKTYISTVTVENQHGEKADGKSLVELLSLHLDEHSSILMSIDGPDEYKASSELVKILKEA